MKLFYTLIRRKQSLVAINKILYIHLPANLSLIETWLSSGDIASPVPF